MLAFRKPTAGLCLCLEMCIVVVHELRKNDRHYRWLQMLAPMVVKALPLPLEPNAKYVKEACELIVEISKTASPELMKTVVASLKSFAKKQKKRQSIV